MNVIHLSAYRREKLPEPPPYWQRLAYAFLMIMAVGGVWAMAVFLLSLERIA